MISFTDSANLDTFLTFPFVPLWGPDKGKTYMLFVIRYREWPNERIFRLDIESGDWVEWEIPTNVYDTTGTMTSACFNATTLQTLFCKSSCIVEFFNFAKHFDLSYPDIRAEVEFQAIDGGETRHKEKEFKYFGLNPCDSGVSVRLGLNGFPPVVPVELDDYSGKELSRFQG